ncbi:protein HOTHEAD [Cinnamomum micranthum f. kanehirae]|uniref:Protein HOTHEAD n=1 Tax=Cinnamomum micranthum f. kanehirae TaxID=337451 RepID=A0A3S3MXJ9_9MAGN|nr:protein HOTHEAD [Cinnamomum micranthum f. kanehirae]
MAPSPYRMLYFILFVSLSICCFVHINAANIGPFMTADVNEVAGKSFDYIIVGGGACGCPLAATLSKSYSVLLVERGGSPYGNHLIEDESSLSLYSLITNESSSFAQPFVSEDGISTYRGRVLGGTTAINGGFYSRASKDFIERAGWEGELVKDAYEWVESKVVFRPYVLTPWQSVVKEALVEAGVTPFNGFTLEHVEGTKIGGRIFDGNRRRHTSADLLTLGNFKRLTVLLNATVQNVIFQQAGDGKGPRARGIRFFNSYNNNSDVYEVYLNQPNKGGPWGDVILSAGALGSPQILMLSGIGPHEHLKQLNISPLINTTEVGKGIQDNPSLALTLNISQVLQKQPPAAAQIMGIANDFRFIIGSLTVPMSLNATMKIISAKVADPLSRGELWLNSTDPRQSPLVKFNYFEKESDLDECVQMARLIESAARTESIEKFLGRKQSGFVDEGASTEEELREYCQKNASTIGHYHGGCLVGSVVDGDYKVFGVEGLRVLDGSTFLDSPGTNPMATVMMLGRYQGIKMLRERQGRK